VTEPEAPPVGEQQPTTQRVRRRASRAAGPAKAEPASDATVASTVRAEASPKRTTQKPTRVKPPPRRQPRRVLVAWISFAAAVLAIGSLVGCLMALVVQQRHAEARQAREQRFVDTATQTVVNMYSYKPDNIDESVNRFVAGTSGPLRGKLSESNNVDNLKYLLHATNATSEAVITGAALESIDSVADNASVLVSVRVTPADINGVNKPSVPYRLRVIVHEDEAGKMTGYDLKWPDGGD
jgi:Mce-associated membrane protein